MSDAENRKEIRQRVHHINQCDELRNLAKAAREDLKRENGNDAHLHLSEMQGRLQSLLDDLDRCLQSNTEQSGGNNE